ncbi:MAG: hypothetical protein KAJ79_04235 [Candidatus Omnitrophica bacterium]|nr:hypothetical protein [Candidatus Omnitrophota bacterium]
MVAWGYILFTVLLEAGRCIGIRKVVTMRSFKTKEKGKRLKEKVGRRIKGLKMVKWLIG